MLDHVVGSQGVVALENALSISKYAAVGLLECVWHADNRDSAKELAADVGWEGDPDALVDALLDTGWVYENRDGSISASANLVVAMTHAGGVA